ncbi:MAG: hypothetical protein IJB27_00865 [Clostridia bacterium]|nr:hypothetical protein [Clostridia bacterium]
MKSKRAYIALCLLNYVSVLLGAALFPFGAFACIYIGLASSIIFGIVHIFLAADRREALKLMGHRLLSTVLSCAVLFLLYAFLVCEQPFQPLAVNVGLFILLCLCGVSVLLCLPSILIKK